MKKFFTVIFCIILALTAIFVALALINTFSEGGMNEYIDSFERVSYENQLAPSVDEDGTAYFTTDGEFKIMHLTDIHLTGGIFGMERDKKALNAVAAMITAEKPDLVVVTGDISFAVPWYGSLNNKHCHGYFTRLMENLGVYYTVTFGNHDAEKYNFYSRTDVAKIYESEELEYSLFERGDENIYGEGNHVINVKNSDGFITKSLIMLDSNAYTDSDIFGLGWDYDNIHDDQIAWYKSAVEKNNAENKDIFDALPDAEKTAENEKYLTAESLLFFHIPLMEVRDAYKAYVKNGSQNSPECEFISGNIGEKDPYVYSSEYEEELFETVTDLGSTKAMFFGHDHYNNAVMKYQGVLFSYGYSIDYSAYFGIDGEGYQRGCTLITFAPQGDIEIVHENYYQHKYKPLYEKEDDIKMFPQKN